jgi:hypothetical protein
MYFILQMITERLLCVRHKLAPHLTPSHLENSQTLQVTTRGQIFMGGEVR